MATKQQVRNIINQRAAQNEAAIPPALQALKAPKATIDALAREHITQYGSFPIALHFPNFYRWLASIPPGHSGDALTSGSFPDVAVAIRTYVNERTSYTDPKGPVAALLDQIMKLASGQALMTAIKLTADVHAVHITPDLIFRLTGTPTADADIFDMTTARNVTAVGMPILDPDRAKPWQGMRDDKGNFVGSGMGTRTVGGTTEHGDDVFVELSPEAYVKGSPSRPSGPGMDPDEVLFHELVHATRQLAGVVYFMPVDKNYDNEEEYLTIVLSNIYIRNKNKGAPLRADHDSGIFLDPDHFLDNVQRVNLAPRMLLERFRLQQLLFFNDLAKIDLSVASFNPVWQYNEELKSGRASRGELTRP
jgi:Effector protein